jgi:SAM-dependent methyltransferase
MGCDSRCKYSEECNFVFEKNGYKIFECRDCHAQFCELNETEAAYLEKVYSDAYFTEGKDGYPDYLEEKDILINHGRWYANMMKRYISPGAMLDVGAAAGFLMQGFRENGWNCIGLEPNLHMTEYGRQKLGLHMVQGDIEHFKVSDKYDLILMVQVIGHIFDLNQALHNTSQLINQDGILLVESWDRGSAAAKFWGRKWHEYSPPSVINYYTKKSLHKIMERHGFRLLKTGRPKKQISLKHALSLASKEYKIFSSLKTLTDKIFKKKDIYLIYPPVDLFYAIYQKQSSVNNLTFV